MPQPVLAVAVAVAAGVIVMHALLLPPPLVLPALSAVLIVTALGMAVLAWTQPQPRTPGARITYWDVSVALYLMGCCAAVFGEPEQVLPLMEEIKLKR
jgi:hypothetical protein